MNKSYKYILLIILSLLCFAQLSCINNINKDNNIKVSNMPTESYNAISLNQFKDELSYIKNKTILSANMVNGKWILKIRISGNKDELKNEISKLKDYDIKDYTINKNKDKTDVVLEISDD